METDFLNIHDGEHLLSHLCDQGMLEDSETSLLEMIQGDFSFPVPQIIDWDPQTVNYDDAGSLLLDGSQAEPKREDFQKMFTEWQEQLETMEASDSEDVDLKDIVEMNMRLSKNIPEGIPNDLFDVSNMELKNILPSKFFPLSEDKTNSILGLETWNDSLNISSFNLENFLENDFEEEHKFGLLISEEEKLEDEQEQKVDESVSREDRMKSNESKEILGNKTKKNVNKKVEKEDTIAECVEGGKSSAAEDESVDVETVVEQIPVLEAGDLNSLLEQFEASEAFNTRGANSAMKGSDTDIVTVHAVSKRDNKKENTSLHETIRDSLPKEVIDRIKASNRRKTISLIPAMPSKKSKGGTRMQDAGATLSRNKLLKLVSGATKGETVQLDHDYCSSTTNSSLSSDVPPPKSFYHSDASEYLTAEHTHESKVAVKDIVNHTSSKSHVEETKVYSRLPEYYVVLAPQKSLEKNRKLNSIKDEVWDKNSRKDSGLESGEVSDASEETVAVNSSVKVSDVIPGSSVNKLRDRKIGAKSVITMESGDKNSSIDNFEKKCVSSIVRSMDCQAVVKEWTRPRNGSPSKPMAMVSVLKKNRLGAAVRQQSLLISSNNLNINGNTQTLDNVENKKPEGSKKKKLNLEEYRSRLKELDRSRSTSTKDNDVANPTVQLPVNLPVPADSISAEPDMAESANDELKGNADCENSPQANASDKIQRPIMHSVEVQTQTSLFDETDGSVTKQHERSRSRKKQRKCYSQRDSSSSSSHSNVSASSHHPRHSRSQIRSRTSRKCSSRGRSASSSGSRQPRSHSNSSHSSSTYSSYSSYSCSRSGSRTPELHCRRSPGHSSLKCQRNYDCESNWRSRSRSPGYRRNDWPSEREKQRQVEERRVIYVGRIEEGTSKAELRQRFEMFGPIVDISVHFREHGDNYGFVTFAYKVDAYEAVEHGNDDPSLPRYDLCFGGRRAFCKTRYADLDGLATSDNRSYSRAVMSNPSRMSSSQSDDFDLLLREAQAKLRKRQV